MNFPQPLTKTTEGRLTVLRCRTPAEAFLVAQELEAADILVVLPDENELTKEFKTQGFVSVRVSTQSYEAAKEVQAVVESKQSENRAELPLPKAMMLAAFVLGMIPVIGFVFYLGPYELYKAKGYVRKAKLFRRIFWITAVVEYISLMTFLNQHH